MRKACTAFVMAAMILGITSEFIAVAQELGGMPKLQAVSGKVASVDLFRGMLTVESKGLFSPGETKTFVISGETDIVDREGRERLRLTDVPLGARVNIEYSTDGSRKVARSIILQEAIRGTKPQAQAAPTPQGAPSLASQAVPMPASPAQRTPAQGSEQVGGHAPIQEEPLQAPTPPQQ